MSPLELAERLDLDSLFDDRQFLYDLRQGTLHNPGKTRMCLLSADLLGGIYQALLEEAGPAWSTILKHCGRVWGERQALRLDRECQSTLGSSLGDLPVARFLEIVTAWFRAHGWGVVVLDLAHSQRGIVCATLEHSVFAEIIPNPEGAPADPLVAGILAAWLSHLSGHELDCLQTACVTAGAPLSRFVISGAERLRRAPAGVSHDDLLARL